MVERVCLKVYVEGRVQGVFFRANTQAIAKQLGVNGWVKNLTDGRVEMHLEGTYSSVGSLVAWALKGPRHARVDRLIAVRVECKDYAVFDIMY
ncbi:MAG: acylphosphatase [Desulfurococcales archaeon]|nr:acylphosphatase [Desulfurococcales archaeon]